MARRLATLALALALGPGCLILQDDPTFEGQVRFQNRPPRIVEEGGGLTPERVVRQSGGAGCALTFTIAVEDPDVDQPLVVEWYVDYDPDVNRTIFESDTLPGGTSLRRQATLLYNFDQAGPNPLRPAGEHLVEVFVYDSTPGANRTALPRGGVPLPDGGTLPDPGFVVSYAWFVTIENAPCPTQ